MSGIESLWAPGTRRGRSRTQGGVLYPRVLPGPRVVQLVEEYGPWSLRGLGTGEKVNSPTSKARKLRGTSSGSSTHSLHLK